MPTAPNADPTCLHVTYDSGYTWRRLVGLEATTKTLWYHIDKSYVFVCSVLFLSLFIYPFIKPSVKNPYKIFSNIS